MPPINNGKTEGTNWDNDLRGLSKSSRIKPEVRLVLTNQRQRFSVVIRVDPLYPRRSSSQFFLPSFLGSDARSDCRRLQASSVIHAKSQE